MAARSTVAAASRTTFNFELSTLDCLQQLADGQLILHDVAGDAGRIRACRQLSAASDENLQLPVVLRRPLDKDIGIRRAVLAESHGLQRSLSHSGEDLVADGGEVHRITASRIAAREGQLAEDVDEVVRR